MDHLDDMGGFTEWTMGGRRGILEGMKDKAKKIEKHLSGEGRRELSAEIGRQLVLALAGRKGLLFHAAGLNIRGQALLLLAPSGGGKSTVASYCRRGYCMHDDKMAVARENGRWLAGSVPMLDNFGRWGQVETAPLGALFLIEKSKQHYLIKLAPREAFPRVAASVIEPTGRKSIRRAVAGTLMELVEEVPVYRLGYVLGEDVSGVVDRRVDE